MVENSEEVEVGVPDVSVWDLKQRASEHSILMELKRILVVEDEEMNLMAYTAANPNGCHMSHCMCALTSLACVCRSFAPTQL
jgi:hypothetical protein